MEQVALTHPIAAAPRIAIAGSPDENALGYRGFCIQFSDPGSREMAVRNGRLWDGVQQREDVGRALERWLLRTGQQHIDLVLAAYVGSMIP